MHGMHEREAGADVVRCNEPGPSERKPGHTGRMKDVGVPESTNLWRVFEAITRRATGSADHVVDITGEDIVRETGLTKPQVHDCVFMLARKGLIKKVRAGARYRPMTLQVLKGIDVTTEAKDDLTMFPCPHCGHRIDVVEAWDRKAAQIQAALKRMRAAALLCS